MSCVWICVNSRVRPAERPLSARQRGVEKKTLTSDVGRKLFNQILFMPGMVIDIIDFCHCIPIPVTLTLRGLYMGSENQNLLP